MNKLKAFTILELVVTMAIMGLVASIAHSVSESTHLQFYRYQNGQNSLSQVSTLNSLLQLDADRSVRMLKTNDGIDFQLPSSIISYSFESALIVRKQADQTDTFKLAPEELSASFNGEMQLLPSALIDRVQFVAYLNESAFPFVVQKQYDARLLLQNELQE